MRFLHTSDWHIGRTIRGRDRMQEAAAVLDEIVEIAADARLDLVIIAGDLFDARVPPAEAEKLVNQTLLRLRDTGAAVVAIAGNHESQPRLEAVVPLFAELGIHLVTKVRLPGDGGIITVPSRSGEETAEIACIPFVPERAFGDASSVFEDIGSWPAAYADQMARLLQVFASHMTPGTLHLMAAHLLASGARFGKGGGEREVTLGPNYAVTASSLPPTLTYLALGHIHQPQRVKGAPSPTWYSGSPWMLDFGEERDDKSVQIVEASAGKPPKVEQVRLGRHRRLVTLKGPLSELLSEAEAHDEHYVRLLVELDGPQPGLADQLRDAFPGAVTITPIYPAVDEQEHEPIEGLPMRDRFERFLSTKGIEEAAWLMSGFDDLIEGIDL
ncbi:MAG: exonuclease SbcCD subunit D [Actinomycetota bacterium]